MYGGMIMGNFRLIVGNYSKIYTWDAHRNAITSSWSVIYSTPILTKIVMHRKIVVKVWHADIQKKGNIFVTDEMKKQGKRKQEINP